MSGARISPLAGKLLDPARADQTGRPGRRLFFRRPDPSQPSQRIHFGTSGHRGRHSAIRSTNRTSGDRPIDLPLSQAPWNRRPPVPRHRHPCPFPAGVRHRARSVRRERRRDDDRRGDGYTPTPAISHAILAYNRGPQRGGSPTASFSRRRTILRKMAASSTTRRPAARPIPTVTGWIEDEAQPAARNRVRDVRRVPYERARRRPRSPPRLCRAIMSATSPA